jgi:hypothetical protein
MMLATLSAVPADTISDQVDLGSIVSGIHIDRKT